MMKPHKTQTQSAFIQTDQASTSTLAQLPTAQPLPKQDSNTSERSQPRMSMQLSSTPSNLQLTSFNQA